MFNALKKMIERKSISSSRELSDYMRTGGQTVSGTYVSPETAMRTVAFNAGVRIITESVSMLPWILYRKLEGGGKERATKHRLYKILNGDEPNEFQTSYMFKEMITGSAVHRGNGYAEINKVNDDNDVYELLPINPQRVTPVLDKNFVLKYEVDGANGSKRILPASKVLHIPAFSTNGVSGQSVIELHKETIGLTVATEQYGAAFFGNGARPSGILSSPAKMTNEQKSALAAELRENFTSKNAGRPIILDTGWDWKAFEMTAEEAQFLETRKYQVADIARMLRIPLHMLGDLDRATNNNIEHQSQEFVTMSLLPWCKRIEGACNKRLLSERERDEGYFVEILVDGLLRGDSRARAAFYKDLYYLGSLNADEIRELENKNPLPDGAGKIYYRQQNMVPSQDDVAGDIVDPKDDANKENAGDKDA